MSSKYFGITKTPMKIYTIIENDIEYEIQEHLSGHKYWFIKNLHKYWFIKNLRNYVKLETPNYTVYLKNNKIHREDGPAIIHSDGEEQYYLNGKFYHNISSVDELIIASIIE